MKYLMIIRVLSWVLFMFIVAFAIGWCLGTPEINHGQIVSLVILLALASFHDKGKNTMVKYLDR